MTKSVWQYQRELMAASDQEMPDHARLTKGSLLYFALNLEELAELGRGIDKALRSADTNMPIADEIDGFIDEMERCSKRIRYLIRDLPDGWFVIPSREHFREMMDGNTDLMVTNAGFAVSTGIDGERSYDRIGTSNLSKRNPETGKIDKTPDGKWIKGVNYQEPDLSDLIEEAYREQ